MKSVHKFTKCNTKLFNMFDGRALNTAHHRKMYTKTINYK